MRIITPTLSLLALFILVLAAAGAEQAPKSQWKILVAHRGASAYAPEHTLEAYRLAIAQGADFVEQDLQITKDGVLICMHDLTLERTTDVESVFPDRARTEKNGERRYYVSDFTLAELKKLDAGSWFDEKARGARIPTFQEAIDLVRSRAGIYPETKGPEVYGSRGFDMERMVLDLLRKNGLDQPGADARTPVIIQSFSAESLKKMTFELKTKLPLTFLINDDKEGKWLKGDGLKEVRKFATGIGPAKRLIEDDPQIVKRAHAAGLTVTPYTFRSSATGKYKDVGEEMRHFLFTLGVDALFTDNPDRFPRRP